MDENKKTSGQGKRSKPAQKKQTTRKVATKKKTPTHASSKSKKTLNTEKKTSRVVAENRPKRGRPRSAKSSMGTPMNRVVEEMQPQNVAVNFPTSELKPKKNLKMKSKSGISQKPKTVEQIKQHGEWEILSDDMKEKLRRGRRKKAVKIIFLGGVGEIGKNMTAFEYDDDIIIVDAGLTFPNNEDMPGIDAVVPDVTYLAQNKDKVRGILLTHGHEDHIGGLAYLMKELNEDTPIYGTRLTLTLADGKLQEHRMSGLNECVVTCGERITLGAFEIEFINVNHSISGAVALAIRTPIGLIYHSGDYKIDMTPVAGEPIDLHRISELGKEGVLLSMFESTNIERMGYTMSEAVVGSTLDHLFAEHVKRRLIIATFASNVHRLQQIIDLAAKYKRKVALSGRSMFKVVDAAVKLGELIIPEDILIDVELIKNYFDEEVLIVSTGTQGEPMSALTRMATGEFNKVAIGENDTIIISANPIPGNEKPVYRVINNLYKKGAKVIYESLERVHVSGHACQEEHKILHTLLKPKFFIPIHGEYRHLKRHAQLVEELGVPSQNIVITEIGNCVELTEKSIKLIENVQAGTRLIDGGGFEDYGTSEVMKERLRMSSDGIFVVSLAISDNVLVNDPAIEARGFVFVESNEIHTELRAVVQKTVEGYKYNNLGTKEELASCIKRAIGNYLYKKTKQSPLIIISILDI